MSTASCLVTAKWDYSNDETTLKQTDQFQAHRLKTPYRILLGGIDVNYAKNVVTTKNKIRGRGRALSLDFRTEATKPLTLLGWGITYTGGSSV